MPTIELTQTEIIYLEILLMRARTTSQPIGMGGEDSNQSIADKLQEA